MTDPRTVWRKRTAFMWLAAAPALVLAVIWAVTMDPLPPVDAFVLERVQPESEDQKDDESAPGIDAKAFHVRLWNPPPPPAKPQEQPAIVERPVPLNLLLIGIIDDGAVESRRAAVYDPTIDVLYIVGNGESLQQHTVTEIAATYVELQTGRQIRRLHLTPGTPGTPGTPAPQGTSGTTGPTGIHGTPGLYGTSSEASETAPAGRRGS